MFAVAACGGGGGSKAKEPKAPAVDEKQAQKDATGLVTELYGYLGRGASRDSFFSLLVEPLVVIGPGKTNAWSNRTDALVVFGDTFDKKKMALRSGSLEVVVSPGGRSGWAFDMIDLDGKKLAATAILENADDIWQVSTLSLAHMYSGKEIKAELAKEAVVPPGAAAPKSIADDAEDAVDKFKKGLLDQARWGDELAARSDAIVVGPTTGDVVKGKKDIKKAWKKRVDAKTRAAISGEIVAGVSEDGQLAWVSAPITRVVEDDPPMPLRAFAVFEKAGDDWKLIVLHEAVAFGEPGSGAPFAKIAPPAFEEKPPPEAADKKDAKKQDAKKTDSKKKKPKKKKKKKVVVEDEDG